VLGEETVIKWYADYPKKYSGARMAELAKSNGRRFALVDVVADDGTQAANSPSHESTDREVAMK